MAAWLHAMQQERVQEDGWLTEQLRVLKSKLRTLLEGRGGRAPL